MKLYKLLIVVLLFTISCKSKPAEIVKQADSSIYYTCSMHPQVMQDKPGNCPICGMELIAVTKSVNTTFDEIKLSDLQIQLGGIHTDTISKSTISEKTVLTGTLNFNQINAVSINSRVMGRVEHLYFKNVGDQIHAGEKLYDLYSEDLNNAKQEYLLAIEKQKNITDAVIDFSAIIKSAKNKLLLWGMSEEQINQLKNNRTETLTSFFSKSSGYITSIDVKEGDYIMEGGLVFKLSNLSTLWAEAQVYTSQLSHIDKQATAVVQIPDIPGKEFKGTISFINPEINPDTRINLIRISIPNNNNQLRPGMPVYVFIKNAQKKALTLPIDAVLRNSNVAMVWVQTGSNTFKTRMVELGLETDDMIEIKSGIKIGDIVVTQGVYLLNSEYIFKNGVNPMDQHDMSKM
jgi:Cu(I)/Ag(I) efflux system membrane fusion protein